ncbi:cytochrome p450 [Rhizoctonia solani]|uniref:Cytochrome p450 n=1 Tax=Rhizoctonia solani TaxID=456999 RepID=A0A8H7I3D9_9AGAM|nr:cytochrome p450 [Rhizoctonia solani]
MPVFRSLPSPPCVALPSVQHQKRKQARLPLPPSVKSDPIIGHLRYLPSDDEPRAYRDWGKELDSDIISMTVLGQTIVVINSLDTATELLGKRSSIYSDRPELPMLNDEKLVGWGNNTGNIRYGDNWRMQRRLTHAVLHKKASEDLWPGMVKQTRLALQRLLDNPDNFTEEFRRMSGSTLLSSVYGYEVSSYDDGLVKVVENAVHLHTRVDAWCCMEAYSERLAKNVQEMVNVPYSWAKDQISKGIAPHSILRQMLGLSKDGDSHSEEARQQLEERIRWATATLFAAGTDTSVATVIVFVLAMVLHPEVQAKAQAEIDSVLGGSRLPEMTDRESLPYVCCIVKEVLRWWPAFPLGVPHASTQDDVYRGYFIPKGSTVIGNTWAICNDPNLYPNPERFYPDRFLDPSVPNAPGFGYGRRSCPGVHFAESTLFITMCTLLTVFDISPRSTRMGTGATQGGKGTQLDD